MPEAQSWQCESTCGYKKVFVGYYLVDSVQSTISEDAEDGVTCSGQGEWKTIIQLCHIGTQSGYCATLHHRVMQTGYKINYTKIGSQSEILCQMCNQKRVAPEIPTVIASFEEEFEVLLICRVRHWIFPSRFTNFMDAYKATHTDDKGLWMVRCNAVS